MSDHRPPPDIERFLGDPTRDLDDWRRLWDDDLAFPVRSGRGGLAGRLLRGVKKLLRPLVRWSLGDALDRQRTWNLIALEHLQRLEAARRRQEERLEGQEVFLRKALQEALQHNDALYARADQKLDRYRAEAHELTVALGGALAALEQAGSEAAADPGGEAAAPPAPALAEALDERAYLELERRYRGTEEEIAERLSVYLPYLERLPASRPVLDLGCGRGEAMAVFTGAGLEVRGVDANAHMVARCRERGLDVEQGDLFTVLAGADEGSLGGVVSFHVIEHLPPAAVDRLVRLARRALVPGGALILETPNPLSVLVAARSFWLDPTHVRPVHPETLRLFYELAGFEGVEHLPLHPYPERRRLPEIDLASLSEGQRDLADRVNRLRDRLDDLLCGAQDYALVGWRGR